MFQILTLKYTDVSTVRVSRNTLKHLTNLSSKLIHAPNIPSLLQDVPVHIRTLIRLHSIPFSYTASSRHHNLKTPIFEHHHTKKKPPTTAVYHHRLPNSYNGPIYPYPAHPQNRPREVPRARLAMLRMYVPTPPTSLLLDGATAC